MTERATWRRQRSHEISFTSLSKAHKRTATPEEEASTRARKEQDQQTQEKTKNQERGDTGQSGKGEQQEQSVQDTITFLHDLFKSKPLTVTLIDEETQQWMEWRCLLRRIASYLREKRFTV